MLQENNAINLDLLRDKWIPVTEILEREELGCGAEAKTVRYAGLPERISYEELLTSSKKYAVSHPRSDIEFWTEALCISMTQVIFTPLDAWETMDMLGEPMSKEHFLQGVEDKRFKDFFCVGGETPFMQSKWPFKKLAEKDLEKQRQGVRKVFPGYSDSKIHFTKSGEMSAVCPGCFAAAAYGTASVVPMGGAGYKVNLNPRGVTVFVDDPDFRKKIWKNVIHKDNQLIKNYLEKDRIDKPIWAMSEEEVKLASTEVVNGKATIPLRNIGLFCGLFWQPVSVLVEWRVNEDKDVVCDCCGKFSEILSSDAFLCKSHWGNTKGAPWIHPHMPYVTYVPKETKTVALRACEFKGYRGFHPVWSQLLDIIPPDGGSAEGVVAPEWSAVVRNYKENIGDIEENDAVSLSIGGYVFKRDGATNILRQNRFESVSLSGARKLEGLNDWGLGKVERVVSNGLKIASYVRGAVFGVTKTLASKGLSEKASDAQSSFFSMTELVMRTAVHRAGGMSEKDFKESLEGWLKMLKRDAIDVYDSALKKYSQSDRTRQAVAVGRTRLIKNISMLIKNTRES